MFLIKGIHFYFFVSKSKHLIKHILQLMLLFIILFEIIRIFRKKYAKTYK